MNPISEIVKGISISPTMRIDIQLYGDFFGGEGLIINHFKGLGFKSFSVNEFHDVICGHVSFRPV